VSEVADRRWVRMPQDVMEVPALPPLPTLYLELRPVHGAVHLHLEAPPGPWLEAFEGKRHDTGVDPHESDLALRGGGVRPQGRTPVRDHHEGQGRDDQDRSPHEALLSVRCPAPR